MSIGTHPLPTLGQGQTVASEQVSRVNLPPSESGATAIEATEQSLTTERVLDELRKVSKFQSSMPISTVKTSPYTDAPSLLSSESEFSSTVIELRLGRSSAVVQLRLHAQDRLHPPLVVVGLQKATIPDEAQATTRPSYRGRITGPVQFVNKLLDTWHLGPESACILLGFEPSRLTYVNDVLQGYETLTGRDAKDRIVHLFQIRKLLSALFQDETVENEWLGEPQDVLKGKTPMDLLLEGSMENLLLVREYVELVTGR